jgi:cytochrome c peroxidase
MSSFGKLRTLLGAVFVFAACQAGAQITSIIDDGNFGVGDPDVFAGKYRSYQEQVAKSSTPNSLTVMLGYVKGVSNFTGIAAGVSIDMATGSFVASLNNLTPGVNYTLSLVDDQDDDEFSKEVLPPVLFPIGSVVPTTKSATVRGTIVVSSLGGATVDRIELRISGKEATVVASGSINLFQKLLFGSATLVKSDNTRTYAPASLSTSSLALASIIPVVDTVSILTTTPTSAGTGTLTLGGGATQASGGSQVQLDKLISKGAKLFFEETFEGNGRTCGTCHPRDNNFTIDPAFIATRPANDPLFVAEFNPALANLEKRDLMRQFGLILENLDGLDDPVNKFVMRSVPHTLGLQVTMNQDVTQIAPPTTPAGVGSTPAQMTGWSGDGAPGTGSLRDFATGAVTQHFTTSLQRIPNLHFKLPKNKQLDAMEAFQLSLGRDRDPDLAKITFNDANVQAGKLIFNNGTGDVNAGGRCAVCHNNGGANFSATNPPPAPNTTFPNRNFNTNVEDVPHPGRLVLNFPIDGGFGALPVNANGSFGNLAFNTAPAVEAADTPPFFHNNIASTLEGVIAFYTGPQFNNPRAPAARFAFTPLQVTQVTNFMRALNTLQNIDLAARELDEVTQTSGNPEQEMQNRLQAAFNDTRDAINVLNQKALYPTAVNQLTSARNLISQAQQPNGGNTRRILAGQAISQLNLARATVAVIVP